MNVLILTEGGPSIGFGHITRCLSLYEAFEDVDANIKMLVNGPDSVSPLLNGANHKLCDWHDKKIKDNDIIVIDSYVTDRKFYDQSAKKCKLLVCYDDYQRIDYPDGSIVANCVIGAEKLKYQNENNHYLLGGDFASVRAEIVDSDPIQIKYVIENVLITVGGMDFSPFLIKLLSDLAKVFPYLDYHVVVPQQTFFQKKRMLHVYPRLDIDAYINLIHKCDICISGGGQTTYELANLGIPTISLCLADNQIGNLQGWQESGFIEYAGKYDDIYIDEKIIAAMKKMTSHRSRYRKSKIGQNVIDGKGANRICQKIISLL